MRPHLLYIALFFCLSNGYTQDTLPEPVIKENQKSAPPRFKCGDLSEFMEKYKAYPEKARRKGIQGAVLVRVFLDNEGIIQKERTQIQKGVHPDLDSEAIRLIHLSGDTCGWKPAQMSGHNIATSSIISIAFKID